MIDVCIIGGGAAGMGAALGAYNAGCRNILVIERGDELGGILNQCIHNGFGLHYFKEELTGPSYCERFVNELSQKSIQVKLNTQVLKITEDKEVHYINDLEGYVVIKCATIVVSVGCRERSRHEILLPGSRVAGIYTAGLAQKYLNIDGYLVGKKVFILGSGDIGLIMARRMMLEGAKVLGVAEIMPYSNGLSRNIVQCLQDFDIPLYLSHTVTEIIGKKRLEKIVISEVDSEFKVKPGTDKSFEVDTLLLSVGLIPDNTLLHDLGVVMNDMTKGPVVDSHYETSIKGIFACGNSLHVHDMVDQVTQEGMKAGRFAYLSISSTSLEAKKMSVLTKHPIRYALPNQIILDENNINLYFRVSNPLYNVTLVVKVKDVIIKKVRKEMLIPSEMEMISLSTEDLLKANPQNTIFLEVL